MHVWYLNARVLHKILTNVPDDWSDEAHSHTGVWFGRTKRMAQRTSGSNANYSADLQNCRALIDRCLPPRYCWLLLAACNACLLLVAWWWCRCCSYCYCIYFVRKFSAALCHSHSRVFVLILSRIRELFACAGYYLLLTWFVHFCRVTHSYESAPAILFSFFDFCLTNCDVTFCPLHFACKSALVLIVDDETDWMAYEHCSLSSTEKPLLDCWFLGYSAGQGYCQSTKSSAV